VNWWIIVAVWFFETSLYFSSNCTGWRRQSGLTTKCPQVSARGSTIISSRQTLPRSTSSKFCIIIVANCLLYMAVNCRWPSFPSRHPSYLEQSSTARHVSTVTGHLLQSPQDPSLQALLLMTSLLSCRAGEVTCHYGHVTGNRFCYCYYPRPVWRDGFFNCPWLMDTLLHIIPYTWLRPQRTPCQQV